MADPNSSSNYLTTEVLGNSFLHTYDQESNIVGFHAVQDAFCSITSNCRRFVVNNLMVLGGETMEDRVPKRMERGSAGENKGVVDVEECLEGRKDSLVEDVVGADRMEGADDPTESVRRGAEKQLHATSIADRIGLVLLINVLFQLCI